MGEIINLNKVRKAKARAASGQKAADNRVTHGTPKQIRKEADLTARRADKDLDGKRLED